MVRLITNRAKMDPKKIIFAEADHLDVLKALNCFRRRNWSSDFMGNMEIVELKKEVGFETEVKL
jgi:malate dehydrogenase (oxaloacetate-decarboxylating)(NADP+)